MAQGDSVRRDLDKRTRDLSQKKIQPGQGLAAQQIAQNQLQAIQNEQRNNLNQQRVQAQVTAQTQQVAMQAAQIGAMESGPAVETLKRYGLTKPRVIKTQSHDIKVAPPNITINNTTNNTTTTGIGPTPGREIAFKQPQQSTNKFKAWLSGLLLSQKEENSKRERDFNKREAILVRSSNKMLKRIEAAGRDIATNLNPKVIGTTVGNQFRMLFMIFALGFLAKHWEKVLNGIDKVIGFFKKTLDYFGITGGAEGQRSPFYQDLLKFFGAKNEENSLFQVFGRLGKELMDYLKMKLDHAMSLRGEAIKNIKFPEIDTGDIFKTLSSIAGYVGNILTAMMDPKKGVADSIKREINSSGSAIVRDSEKEKIKFSDEVKGVRGLKDTSYGDYAAEVRQTLTQNALTDDGALRNNTWASISQGRDLVQAFNNSKNGVIDIARMGGGLQRLSDTANKEGHVTLDASSINALFGDKLMPLIQSGDIKTVPMKYVQVKKTEQDLADEGASGWDSFAKGYMTGALIDKIPGNGVIGTTAGALKGTSIAGPLGTLPGATIGYLKTTSWGNAAIEGTKGAVKSLIADDNILKLVPADDPRPGVALGGQTIRNYYQVSPKALDRLATILTKDDEITRIDSGSEKFMKALESHLVERAGGTGRVKSRDYDLQTGYQSVRELEKKEEFFRREEDNSAWSQSVNVISNNAKGLANRAYQGLGLTISTVGNYITNFSSGSSDQIKNWLWGGTAPREYNPRDAAHMSALMTRVTVPIHDLQGNESTHTLTVHKYLAEDVKSIFQEIFTTTTFKIDRNTTGAFAYRKVNNNSGSNRLSPHSFGMAIDINWQINYLNDTRTTNTDTHLGTKAHPVVQIFMKHSWKWLGKDATGKFADPMHFEYAGKPHQVGQQAEGVQYGYVSQEQSDAANAGYVSQPIIMSGSYSASGSTSGGMTYVAQGSYVGYQAPIIQPTGQPEWLNWKESAGAGAGRTNNNPGNRTGVDTKFGSGISVGKHGHKFTTYGNLSDGFAGNADLVISYLSGAKGPHKRNPTVREFINSWCPPTGNGGESAAATEQYIQNVARWSGFGTDTQIPLTYDSVLTMNACLARQDSGIVNKEALVEGTSKAWTLYNENYVKTDAYENPKTGDYDNLASFGNWVSDLGQDMQSTQLFDVKSPEEIERENRRSQNILKLQDSFSVTDNGISLKDNYYKNIYGVNASVDDILGVWDENPEQMERDIKYSPRYAKAEELWSKFGKDDIEVRTKLFGGATDKQDFIKRFSQLEPKDQNHLIRTVNRWIRGHNKKLDDYKDIKFNGKNIMDAMSDADKETKEKYTRLMSTGQYKEAEELIYDYYNDEFERKVEHDKKWTGGANLKNIERARVQKIDKATERFREGKAYHLHGDEYKQLQKDLENARLDLEDAKKRQKDANEGYWDSWGHVFTSNKKIDAERKKTAEEVKKAQERFDKLHIQSEEYKKLDEHINDISDYDAGIVSAFDDKTKRSIEIGERLKEIDNNIHGVGTEKYSNTKDFLEAEKRWNEEKEALLKELGENEESIKKLIGEDQKDLLISHKNKMKEIYEKMGKGVTDAENEYLKLIKDGKTHQEAMAEIGEKFDKETLSYLQSFGDAIVEEKKRAEEAARQQLRMLAAQLANVDIGSIDWDDEYFQGATTSGELGKRAKIKNLADRGMPIPAGSITENEIPPGYEWNQQENCYLPKDESKRAIRRYGDVYRSKGGTTDAVTGKKISAGTLVRSVNKDYSTKMAAAIKSSETELGQVTNNLLVDQNATLESINSQMTLLNKTNAATADWTMRSYSYFQNNQYPYMIQPPTFPIKTQ